MTIETAKKAKHDGVKQFIFMSSIIVYGECSSTKDKKLITVNTIPLPSNVYGDSKLQAEDGLMSLQSKDFHIVILRPPMVYGKGSKGNYSKLSYLAKVTCIFPNIQNERSMLHIDNLCEFIRLVIDHKEHGVFYPQNEEYVCTSELVKLIAKVHGREIRLVSILNPIIIKIIPKGILIKMFGSLLYDMEMSHYKVNYRVHNFYETIHMTEI